METTVDEGALVGIRCLCTNVEHAYFWKYVCDDERRARIEPGELSFEIRPGDVADIAD
jgi:hypothetical protein